MVDFCAAMISALCSRRGFVIQAVVCVLLVCWKETHPLCSGLISRPCGGWTWLCCVRTQQLGFINVESSDGSDTFSMMWGIRSRREASKANPVLVKIKGRSEMNFCVLCRILRQPKLAKMKCSGPEPRVLISLLCWHAYAAVPFQLV